MVNPRHQTPQGQSVAKPETPLQNIQVEYYNGNIYTSKTTSLYWDLLVCGFSSMEPVSLRIMTSQFKDIVITRKNTRQWNAYFAVYGYEILCEISKVPFEILHKILNPKICILRGVKIRRIMIYQNYDVWSLSETGPRSVSLCRENVPVDCLPHADTHRGVDQKLGHIDMLDKHLDPGISTDKPIRDGPRWYKPQRMRTEYLHRPFLITNPVTRVRHLTTITLNTIL